jgi:hypothetical protein
MIEYSTLLARFIKNKKNPLYPIDEKLILEIE